MKITRIDEENSFLTVLKIEWDNIIQNLEVYVWEADIIEKKLKSLTIKQIKLLSDISGEKIIKESKK